MKNSLIEYLRKQTSFNQTQTLANLEKQSIVFSHCGKKTELINFLESDP